MTVAARMGAVRMRTIPLAVLACVVATTLEPAALAKAKPPEPAYTWVLDATLIVTGRVESVGTDKATLRVAKTLAGHADSETIEFAPVSRPQCMSGRIDRDEPIPADVAVGDEVALFLVKGEDASFEVLDGGYAMVGVGALRARSPLDLAPLADVERLVSVMKTADIDARDRGMIAAATADDQFLRRAACGYVGRDLGVASRTDRRGSGAGAIAAAAEVHRAAVRRLGKEIAALVVRENGEEPCSAALGALAQASCLPDGAFDAIVAYARATSHLGQSGFGSACEVIALSDSADAVSVLIEFSAEHPGVLVLLGDVGRPEVRAKLLAEFGGDDHDRVVAATRGLGRLLRRGHDADVEDALLARLRDPKVLVGPTMERALGSALISTRALDVANAVLDKLASKSLSREGEEAGADVLYGCIREEPPIPGFRELLVKRLAVITDRLDAGKTEATRPLYLLQQLGTPEAMASLRHAAQSHPDPEMRQAAESRSAPLGK